MLLAVEILRRDELSENLKIESIEADKFKVGEK